MLDWEKMPTIGDIITNFAPFLKMYAEYVRNFDHASKLIATMTAKCSRFSNLVDEIQVRRPFLWVSYYIPTIQLR